MRVRLAAAGSLLLVACAAGDTSPDQPDAVPPPIESDAGVPGVDAGGAPSDCACAIELRYPAAGVTSVELRGNFASDGWDQGIAMTPSGDSFVASLELPHGRVLHYKFFVDGATWVVDPANPERVGDGFGGENSVLAADCGCAPLAFDWRDAILYFVLVDRFRNGDPSNDVSVPGVEEPANFAGGDLAGVMQAIEEGYFDELGVNVLWLSAPIDNADGPGIGDDGRNYSAYHGYWPEDLEAVDPRVGDEETLRAVIDAAHARGLRVILDYVMNHVHADSPLYAAHPDWFWPLQDGARTCVCGEGCSWDPPDGLRCWFRPYLPDFDFRNAAARDYSVGNAVAWVKRTGADGYRLDAVKHIETSWVTDVRARLTDEVGFGDRRFYLIGETFTGDRGLIRSYVDPATMLDGQFDFPMRAQVVRNLLMRQGSMDDLRAFLDGNDAYYGAGAIMGTFLGNHDLPRAIHFGEDPPQFGEWDAGKSRGWSNQPSLPTGGAPFDRLLLGFTLLFTLPGAPLIYYGDELGMAGAGDPDNRRPMTWTGTTPDQERVRAGVARLARIRSEHPALRRGTRTTLEATNDVFVYQMSDGGDTLVIGLNRSDAPANGIPSGTWHDLITDSPAPAMIPARSAVILVLP